MPDRLTLTAAIGATAWRDGLQRAQDVASGLRLSFVDISPIHRAFAPMVREQKFDVCELAIVTALQGFAYGKPLVILPVAMAARFQQSCLIARRADVPVSVSALRGRRIGVRAYTQTTGVWLRGVLQNDYGVAPDSVRWVTQEGAHVAEYRDPAWVEPRAEHAAPLASLPDLLRRGDIDAAILGNDLPDDPDFVPVIAAPEAAAQAWYAAHGVVPINHLLVVRKEIATMHPQAIHDLWRMLSLARPRGSSAPDMAPIGVEAHRRPLKLLLRYCEQQQLLPRRLDVDEIFADAIGLLGAG
jgi:4,5-dihydroxyphthalate decarboxylase